MNTTDWARLRIKPIALPTLAKRGIIHTDLLIAARRRAGGAVLEVGAGSGAQAVVLSRLVPLTVSIDNNASMLDIARTNFVRFGAAVKLLAADTFGLPFRSASFGVALSQGLFEHFPDHEIGSMLREQLRVCRSVVFSVPSDHYPRQDAGDERLMSPRAWRDIVAAGVDTTRFRIAARYYRVDPEAVKYSLLAGRWLGRFHVLVTIDPR